MPSLPTGERRDAVASRRTTSTQGARGALAGSQHRLHHKAADTTKKGNDSVLVAVDRATKFVHIVPCQEAISARHTALLYWRNVARYHGIPRTIFSDRDVRFTSQFWKSLWKFFGTGLHFSTSFHPQTQGQVERVNAMFEQILRCTVHELGEPRNWDDMVPYIEFCINTQPNRSTGYSAFYLLYGHHPLTPIELIKESDKNSVEMVDRFAHRLRKLIPKGERKCPSSQ